MRVVSIIDGFDLTKGKIYDVIFEYDSVYELKCDTGQYCRNKDFFEVLPDFTVPEKPKFEDCECDNLKAWCRWEGPATSCGPNGPITCDGMYCKEAYENMLDDYFCECDVCHRVVSVEDGTDVIDTSDGSRVFVCDDCDIPDAGCK